MVICLDAGNMKKDIKKRIWAKLEKDGYITDTELTKIYGGEPNFYVAETYKREYLNLKRDVDFFGDTVCRIGKFRRSYKASTTYTGNGWYKISKAYYERLKAFFEKDNSRPDLTGLEMYYRVRYYYEGNELYNIKKLTDSIMGYDLLANWKDKKDGDKEKLGKFYLKDLVVDNFQNPAKIGV